MLQNLLSAAVVIDALRVNREKTEQASRGTRTMLLPKLFACQ